MANDITLGTTFYYATEVPYPNMYCHGPLTCTLTESQTTTVTWSTSLSPKFLDALKVGVTGTFSHATANSKARSFQIKLEQGQCGYFTFVPIAKSIWYGPLRPVYATSIA